MNRADTEALVEEVRAWSVGPRRRAHLALMEQPPLFDIELSSACNIDCVFCPRADIVRGDTRGPAHVRGHH